MSDLTDILFVEQDEYFCPSCNKLLEDAAPLRECSNDNCGEKFVSEDRACPSCNRTFTRRLADKGCEDCNEEGQEGPCFQCPQCELAYEDEEKARECCEDEKKPTYIEALEAEVERLSGLLTTASVAMIAADKKHEGHGTGTESGPDDSSCPCREDVAACARAGCGFCNAIMNAAIAHIAAPGLKKIAKAKSPLQETIDEANENPYNCTHAETVPCDVGVEGCNWPGANPPDVKKLTPSQKAELDAYDAAMAEVAAPFKFKTLTPSETKKVKRVLKKLAKKIKSEPETLYDPPFKDATGDCPGCGGVLHPPDKYCPACKADRADT